MFFVVRLWDAFADMFAGRLVDRTMTKMGKFRPFILFGAVPLLFLSYLTFHVPSSLDGGGKLLYAYVTYAVLGLLYSMVNIPYGSLASAMTQSVKERAKLVSSRFFGGALGGIVLTYVIAPRISALEGEKKTLSVASPVSACGLSRPTLPSSSIAGRVRRTGSRSTTSRLLSRKSRRMGRSWSARNCCRAGHIDTTNSDRSCTASD